MPQTIINGQSAMKSELLGEIQRIDKKLSTDIGNLREETKKGFKQLTERIDKIGRLVAQLDDDAPTGEEFSELEKRVGRLEQKIAS